MKNIMGMILIGVLVATLSQSCVMPASNITMAPDANLSNYRTIAIWKFEDGGRVSNSGDIATRAIESAFMSAGYKLVSYSKIRNIIAVEIGYREGMALDAGMLTMDVLDRIRTDTGADGLILGSVSNAFIDISMVPSSWIECSFQLIDTKTGEVVVSGMVSDDGWSLQSAATQMAVKAVRKLRKN